MTNIIERTSTDIERNLKNLSFAFKLYAGAFLISTVVFFIFGIVPLSSVLKTKLNLIKEMTTDMDNLKSNLTYLQQADTDINSNLIYVGYLDKFMPRQTNVQSYMLDFIQSVGANGFTVNSFSEDSTNVAAGQINLIVSLDGSSYPTDLINLIEALKRPTQVSQVLLSHPTPEMSTLNLHLTIYTLLL